MKSLLFFLLLATLFVFTYSQGCLEIEDCADCAAQDACGWCDDDETCYAGDDDGPGGNPSNCTDWFKGDCAPVCEQFDSNECEGCTSESNCGFCLASEECLAGNDEGPLDGECGDWTFEDSGCEPEETTDTTTSTTGRRDPTTGRRDPTTGRRDPTTGRRDPTTGRRDPTTGRRSGTTSGRRDPTTTGGRKTTTGTRKSTTGRRTTTGGSTSSSTTGSVGSSAAGAASMVSPSVCFTVFVAIVAAFNF